MALHAGSSVASGGTLSYPLLAPNGSNTAPSYANTTGKTGVYFSGETMLFAANQTLVATISSTAITMSGNILPASDNIYQIGATNNRFAVFSSSIDSGNSTFNLLTNSILGLSIDTAQLATFAGSVTGLSFIPSSSTVPSNGMYLSAANEVSFSTNTTQAFKLNSSQAATFLGNANFNKGLIQSGTTSIALNMTCTNNEIIQKMTGDAGGATSTQIYELQTFYSTQKLASIQFLNTNATAASSGGIVQLVVNKGDGTLYTGLKIDNNGLVTLGTTSNLGRATLNLSAATAASNVLTITNGPTGTSGNPTKWLQAIDGAGNNGVIPFWQGA